MGLQVDGVSESPGGQHGRLELGSDKERVLLAALALDAGRPVPIDTLMARLWDDEPPRQARESVHSYVSRLRRRLRLACAAAPDAPRITSRSHTYVLETDPAVVDWHRFRRLVDSSPPEGDDLRAAALARAEELWRGEALAGLPGEWARTVRRTLAEKRDDATAARISARLRLGHFAETVGELSALVERRPGDEALLGQLMLAYYGSGRFTEALRVHQRARELLRADYGALPGAELNRIHRGVLERVDPADLVRRASAPVSADEPPPRRSGLPAAPAAPEAALPPRGLPHQPPLVGRREESRKLSAAIEGEGPVVSVVAISGMAGAGKSALAVHTARQLARRFPDGQLHVNLRAHSPTQEPLTPGAALATLLRLLGAPAAHIPLEPEARSALWRTMLAERRAVIVLDDAAGADQIRPLLTGDSPSLTIITSRRQLSGVPGALALPLDVLPEDDAVTLFRSFAGEERTGDLTETARIVRLCGFLPLAIELIAHRFRVRTSWTLATLGERLARTPGRLAEIRDTDHEMTRAFDLSYRTLTEAQRRAFRRLGLHPGQDFSADAAAALLGLPPGETERLLEALCAFHLLRETAQDRYRAHDLIQEYAHALAISEDPEEERSSALGRLTDYYLRTARGADHLTYPRRLRVRSSSGPDVAANRWSGPDEAKAWLTAERANILAAERHAHSGAHREAAAQLAYAVAGLLDSECHWQDAESVLRRAADHWASTGDEPRLCHALILLGAVQANVGRYPEAMANGERGLAIARRTGDTEAEAEALRTLGMLNLHLGENRAALVLLQKSFAIKAVIGDMWDKARGHNNLAIVLPFLGEHERALEHYRKALQGFRDAFDTLSVAKTLSNMGTLFRRTHEKDSALRCFEESLLIMETAGNRWDRATVRGNLADTLTDTGDWAAALPLYQETLHEFRSLGDQKSMADTLIGIGEVHRNSGAGAEAVAHLLEALSIARSIGAAHQEIQALRRLGRAEFALGRADAAVSSLRAAVALASQTDDVDEAIKARSALAEVLLAMKSERGHGTGQS
ncbi:tetratricopeptide repeat protein [Streptomyces sp. NPDC014894]|uniref:AfsR/SARP family transcriptional regulator n=1 Tax=unclassified Streptomyces TaxID=2593676 RepID=UPI0036FFE84B